MTGINPAHNTRFGSSKPAEMLWQDRIYRMSFCLVRWSPRQTHRPRSRGHPCVTTRSKHHIHRWIEAEGAGVLDMVIGLDCRVHLGDLVPRLDQVEAIGEAADRAPERGFDAHVL